MHDVEGLKEYTDEGFNALRRSLDQFREEYYQHVGAYHTQLDVKNAGVINQFHIEVDRRFIEADAQVKTALVSAEKALAVKQEADEKALDLARDIQTYKDETHNGLIKQLSDERGHFVSQEQYQTAIDALAQLRQDLTELNGIVVPRSENESWRSQISDRLNDNTRLLTERVNSLELRLSSRLDLDQGSQQGERAATGSPYDEARVLEAKELARAASQRSLITIGISVVLMIISIVSVLYAVIHK